MTEREYIDATNLAKVRAAKTILLDTLEMDVTEKQFRLTAIEALRAWETRLQKVVRTSR